MERIRIDNASANMEAIAKAVETLQKGGVILFPTDTLYGLGADALSDSAVDKIYRIKGRGEDKPIHAVVSDMSMAAQYAIVDDYARILSKRFLPGPLTLVLRKKPSVLTGIARDIETIGIRIPNNEFCAALVRAYGKPITATSANKSGALPEAALDAILEQLGDATQEIDLIIEDNAAISGSPSTVVDTSGGRPLILREGAISALEIWSELGIEEPEAAG